MNTRTTLVCSAGMLCTLLLAPAACQADDIAVTDDWSIEITPALKLPLQNDVSVDSATDAQGNQRTVDVADYDRIYQSIPFRRWEYNGNPTYRHDSAMEILTGNARHNTIVRHDNSRAQRPVATSPYGVVPYRYNNPRRGLNYYFYFPYWNYRGLY